MKLKYHKILVTGGTGFIGTAVVEYIKKNYKCEVVAPSRNECSLLDESSIRRFLDGYQPDLVIHLGAKVGGILDIKEHPASYYYENIKMSLELLEQCRLHKIKKFVAIGSNCSYPEGVRVPYQEKDLLNGYPEKTNAPYGNAKRVLYEQCLYYKRQYDMHFSYLIPTNAYGPGDHYNTSKNHVIPSFIEKFSRAKEEKQQEVVLWGSGNATREFIYIKDVAELIVESSFQYEEVDPLNIGTGIEISMKELAELIANLVGYKGKLVWDTSKPEGYLRKGLDSSRMRHFFPQKQFTPIQEGLKLTIEEYQKQKK